MALTSLVLCQVKQLAAAGLAHQFQAVRGCWGAAGITLHKSAPAAMPAV